MSRIKKSRKPGRGSSGVSKTEVAPKQPKEKRIRKKTGNTPGSRQQVIKSKNESAGSVQKDPRLGSKKPIELTPNKPVQVKEKTTAPKTHVGIAKVRTVPSQVQLLQAELAAIEADAYLQEIIEKQETEQPLSEADVDHYNQLMERHEEISKALGLDGAESIDEDFDNEDVLSEEDLWEKFNDGDYLSTDDF